MNTRRVESFLLRIVVSEGQPLMPERWRGRIHHIASGAERQIDELADAIAFINNHISALPDAEQAFELTQSPEQ